MTNKYKIPRRFSIIFTRWKTMYFSRESYFEKDYEKDSLSNTRFSQLYLFKATKLGDDWDTLKV